ncbi:MAG: helix-turn-helix domain-containing protein [Proteobacteria bacterium]|nr:helix-turn-helix domain-containing protein [Pseudomonadota bacterium]
MKSKDETRVDRLFVASVEKAFSVLEAFGTDRRDLGLSDVMERTGMEKSAVQRYIHTLNLLGYLEKDVASRRFSLSMKVLEPANSFLRVDPLVTRATPFIFDLRRKIDGRVGVGCMHGHEALYIIPLQSNKVVFQNAHPGFKVPLYSNTTGRVLLSSLPDEQVRKILKKYDMKKVTPYSKVTIEEVLADVQETRLKGYCITEEELRLGDINLAVPLIDSNGFTHGTVTVMCSTSDFTRQDMAQKVAPIVRDTAREIMLAT